MTEQQNNVLKRPIEQKILLQLGQCKDLTIEALALKLKLSNLQEVEKHLLSMGDLVTSTQEPISTVDKPLKKYHLTEKGHNILIQLISYPERFKDHSTKKHTNKKFFYAYWAGVFITTFLVGVILPFYGKVPISKAIVPLAVILLIEALAFYARLKPISLGINRIMYIVLFGASFGCGFSILAIGILSSLGIHEINATVMFAWAICFLLGGLLGDLIGRFRKYKGPQQYGL